MKKPKGDKRISNIATIQKGGNKKPSQIKQPPPANEAKNQTALPITSTLLDSHRGQGSQEDINTASKIF